jgi:hypothetical protein
MTSPKEYRDFALECAKQATEIKDEKLRAILLGTARLWMETAMQVERSLALQDDDHPAPGKEP